MDAWTTWMTTWTFVRAGAHLIVHAFLGPHLPCLECDMPSSTSIYGSFLRTDTRLFRRAIYVSECFCSMKALDMGPVTGASRSFIAIPLPLYDLIAQSVDSVEFHPWLFRPTQYEQRRVLGIFIRAISKPLILT